MRLDDRSYLAQALFRFLDGTGVAYCVVGDTRNFPYDIPSDIDIVLEQRALHEAPAMMLRFAREQGVHLVQLLEHERTARYFVLAWPGRRSEPRFLAPDICGDFARAGRLLLTAEEMLTGRTTGVDAGGHTQAFPVPAPDVQFIYYLLKKIDKCRLDSAQGAFLSSCWLGDPRLAWAQLQRFWPDRADAELIAAAAEENDWLLVHGALPRLRASLHHAVPLGLSAAAGELSRLVRRWLRPAGMTVAVLGPDGSGKSTVIERMCRELAPAFRATRQLHLRPRLLPGGRRAGTAVVDPHGLRVRGVAMSMLKLAWFLFDYIAGYFFRVRPLVARSTLVLFDRYFHDLLVDPRRYRYGGPSALAAVAAWCSPRPDLWILLDAPVEALQERKPEVTPDESERQRRAYRKLISRISNAVVIDASKAPERVAAEAGGAILRHLELRLERRYPELRDEQNPWSARILLFFCRHRVPVLSKLTRILFNCDIYCRFEAPILMPHPYGVVIHSRTVIGRGVTVMHQVTLGSKDPGLNVAPVIEDDVYIGAGAKVLGAVRVGRAAVVGANAVVTRDVPPFHTVVGANRILDVVDSEGPAGVVASEMAPQVRADERLSA
ncbi:MAG TPA: hypothetical protein VD839_10605 [Burkholderiales bacterium]|nr:hypothetical protein [Burkholderiales bacterium]